MTAWEVIRKYVVDSNTRPGTVKRLRALQKASLLYVDLRECLKMVEWEDKMLSDDEELCGAWLNPAMRVLREAGLLK